MSIIYANTLTPYQFQNNKSLTEIKLGDSIQVIPRQCFQGCTNLKKIVIPRSVKRFDYRAFASSGLEEVIFEKDSSLRVIATRCFHWCQLLTTISIPSSIRIIGSFAFYFCNSLQNEISIMGNIREIGNSAFSWCTIPHLSVISEVDGEREKWRVRNREEEREILDDQGQGQAWEQTQTHTREQEQTSIILHIGERAFFNCKNLKTIILFSSVKSIGEYAFADTGVEYIEFSQNSQLEILPNFMLENCCNLKIIKLPSSIRKIGKYVFTASKIDNNSITNLFSNCNIQYIGERAFADCLHFTSIIIPSSIQFIDKAAFSGTMVENIQFSSSSSSSSSSPSIQPLQILPDGIFRGCRNIKILQLPPSITSIGKYAFLGCNIDDTIFDDIFSNCIIQYIDDEAFSYCNKLNSITIPSSVKSIGIGAFSHSSIKKVEFSHDSPLLSIPDKLFQFCNNLKVITFLSLTKIQRIGASAFMCTNIDDDSFYNIFTNCNIQYIGNQAFSYCYNLRSISIPSSVISIGRGGLSLTEISVHSRLEIITAQVFTHSSNINSIIFL